MEVAALTCWKCFNIATLSRFILDYCRCFLGCSWLPSNLVFLLLLCFLFVWVLFFVLGYNNHGIYLLKILLWLLFCPLIKCKLLLSSIMYTKPSSCTPYLTSSLASSFLPWYSVLAILSSWRASVYFILSFPLPGSHLFPQSIVLLLVLQTPLRLHLSKICILMRFFSLDPIPQTNKAKQRTTSRLGSLLLLCVDMTSVPVFSTL